MDRRSYGTVAHHSCLVGGNNNRLSRKFAVVASTSVGCLPACLPARVLCNAVICNHPSHGKKVEKDGHGQKSTHNHASLEQKTFADLTSKRVVDPSSHDTILSHGRV